MIEPPGTEAASQHWPLIGSAGRVFASPEFFYFLVRRYSVHFASPSGGKSLASRWLAGGGEAIFAEFRLRGGTLFVGREAIFVATSCVRGGPPHTTVGFT